jgi:hypothetical protein
MNLREALAAIEGTAHEPPVRLKLYARRTSRGTLIFGHTAGYTLPDSINDAEITIAAEDVQFHTDRTAAFCGHSYITIMEEGRKIIRDHDAKAQP